MKVHILWFTCLQRSLNHHVGTLLGMTISFGPAKPSQSDQIMISGCSGSRLQHVLMYCSSDMRMTKSSITLALPLAAAAACNRCMWVHRHCLPLLLSQWLTLRGGRGGGCFGFHRAGIDRVQIPPDQSLRGLRLRRFFGAATTTCSAGLFLVYQILSRKVCCLGMLQLPSRLWGTHVVQLACAPNFKRWLGGAYFASLVALDTARPEWDPAEENQGRHGMKLRISLHRRPTRGGAPRRDRPKNPVSESGPDLPLRSLKRAMKIRTQLKSKKRSWTLRLSLKRLTSRVQSQPRSLLVIWRKPRPKTGRWPIKVDAATVGTGH